MLEDTDRLRGTVDQVLKAGSVGYKRALRTSTKLISASWSKIAFTWPGRGIIWKTEH